MTGLDFSKQLKHGRYTSLGSYPVFLVMTDGGCLCWDCAKEEAPRIRLAAMVQDTSEWRPASFEVNWESEIYCDNCYQRIESAYGDND